MLIFALVVLAAPIQIDSPQPDYYEEEDDTTCEVQGIFAYSMPEEANNLPPATMLMLVDESGGTAKNVVDLVDEFLSRMENGAKIEVHTFASIEGASGFNRRLSIRRATAIKELIESRSLYQQGDYSIKTQAHGETDQFWPMSSADKARVETYGSGSDEFKETPALIVNRRFVLTTESSLTGAFDPRTPYKFYDKACPIENIPPRIVTPPSGEVFMLIPGDEWGIEIIAEDEDLDAPGSREELTFTLTDNPQGMSMTKTSDRTAFIKYTADTTESLMEQELPFTVTVTDTKRDSDQGTYVIGMVSALPDEENDSNITPPPPVPPVPPIPWYIWLTPLLLILLVLPWAYKRKRMRNEAMYKHKEQIKQLTTWDKIIVFFKEVKEKKGRIKKQIEEINIAIGQLTPELRQRLDAKIKDIAYFYDPASDEFKNLDAEGEIVKKILEQYLDLVQALTDLHSDEMSIEHILIMIERRKLVLRDSIHEQKLMQLTQQTKVVITEIKKETELILLELERETREGGIILSGVVSLIGGNAKHWKKEGFKRWWKTDFGEKWDHFHDPTYLRSEKQFVPHDDPKAGGLIGSFKGPGTRAWEKDYGHRAPRGMKWLLEKDIWPWKKDRIKAVNIIKHMSTQLITQVVKTQEVYTELTVNIDKQIELLQEIIIIIQTAPKEMKVMITHPLNRAVITDEFFEKGAITAEIANGTPNFEYELFWGDRTKAPDGVVSLTTGKLPLNDNRSIHFKFADMKNKMTAAELLDGKYLTGDKYKIEVESFDSANSTATDSVFVRKGGASPPPGPCEEVRDKLLKALKKMKERGLDLEKESILKICGAAYRGELVSGHITELENHLYNDRLKKDWQDLKKLLPELKKIVAGATNAIQTFNPQLVENFEGHNPIGEVNLHILRTKPSNYAKGMFAEKVDNTKQGEARIIRLYGNLPKLNGIDTNFKQGIEALQQKTGGSYNRYTFKFYPALIDFIEKMIAAIEKLCEDKKVIPLPPKRPEIKPPALPPKTDTEAPMDITKGLESAETEEIKRLEEDMMRIGRIEFKDDLATALKIIKREIVKGTNPLFGEKYKVPVREDKMGKTIYRPYRFEVVVFSELFVKQVPKRDKFGRRFPSAVGPTPFTQEIFRQLGIKEATHTLSEICEGIKVRLTALNEIVKKDTNRLHAESSKLPDKQSVVIVDKLISVLEDEWLYLDHIVEKLNEIEWELRSVENCDHKYVKEFKENMAEVAKSNVEWGGGEWGEDDHNVDRFVPALNKWHDIPEFVKMVQEEAAKEANQAFEKIHDALEHIQKIDVEWKKHLEEALRLRPAA